jgi:hypothetical protein
MFSWSCLEVGRMTFLRSDKYQINCDTLHSTAIMIEGPRVSDSSSGSGEHLMLSEAEPAVCNERIHGRIWYVDVGDTGFENEHGGTEDDGDQKPK